MPIDSFQTSADSPSSPARHCFVVEPNDSAELSAITKAIYVGTGGNVVLRAAQSDADVTFANVPTGAILDVRCVAIRADGTTASDIVGLA